MSLLSKVQTGVQKNSQMNVLYGPSGVGKTTFVSQFPNVLVLDIENGSKNLDLARLTSDDIPTYEVLVQTTKDFLTEKHQYKSLVIDSITTLEHYINKSVCAENNVKELGEIAYGRGMAFAKERLKDYITLLKQVQSAGYDVWLIGHSLVKKFSDPTLLQQFDRFSIQGTESFSAEIIRQADNVYFARNDIEVAIDKQTKKAKGIGGDVRTMYTRHNAAYDAKTRLNLPGELPFDYAEYTKAVANNAPRPSSDLIEDIKALITKLKPHDQATAEIAVKKLADAGDKNSQLQIIKNKLIEATKNF